MNEKVWDEKINELKELLSSEALSNAEKQEYALHLCEAYSHVGADKDEIYEAVSLFREVHYGELWHTFETKGRSGYEEPRLSLECRYFWEDEHCYYLAMDAEGGCCAREWDDFRECGDIQLLSSGTSSSIRWTDVDTVAVDKDACPYEGIICFDFKGECKCHYTCGELCESLIMTMVFSPRYLAEHFSK